MLGGEVVNRKWGPPCDPTLAKLSFARAWRNQEPLQLVAHTTIAPRFRLSIVCANSMAVDYSSAENKTRTLIIGFDIGTGFSAACHALISHDAESAPIGTFPTSNLKVVNFDGEIQVPSRLAWYEREREWVWGNEVDTMVEDERIPESHGISKHETLSCDTPLYHPKHMKKWRRRLSQPNLTYLDDSCHCI